MPDLRERYDEATIADLITEPGFDALDQRATTRRHRNRIAAVVGVTALAALVAVPLVLLRPGNDPVPPATSVTWKLQDLQSVEFTDARHGYAKYRNPDRCVTALRATSDGGATWSELREPPAVTCPDPVADPPRLSVLDVDTLTWNSATEHFISHDGGVTWNRYTMRNRTADEVPEGVTPRSTCVFSGRCTDETARIFWYDRQTGHRVVLKNGPGFDGWVTRSADGTIWVEGRRTLGFSRDAGRTWKTHEFDAPGRPMVMPSADGRTVYVAAIDHERDDWALFVTTDAGTTWSSRAATGASNVFRGYVADRGTLLMASDADGPTNSPWYASTDGGVTFAPSHVLPAHVDVRPVGDRFHGMGVDGRNFVSADGLRWRTLEVPARG